MGVDARFVRPDGLPLGDLASVHQALRIVFPQLRVWQEVSGREKLRIADEKGIQIPEQVRQMIDGLPPLEKAAVQDDEFALDITLGVVGVKPIEFIEFTIRGHCYPEKQFKQLEEKIGWKVVGCSNGPDDFEVRLNRV